MDKQRKIRVAIAEDNAMLAESIIDKIQIFEDELQYTFTAINGQDLLDKLYGDSNVHTILMDIEMPKMDGITCTAKVREKYPDIKIIMLTVFDDEDKIFRSIQAGANGYLLKEEPPHLLYESIKMIMAGGAPMTPVIAAKSMALLRSVASTGAREDDGQTEQIQLTNRQVEVLQCLSEGMDYQAIAEKLFVSPFTVRKHIENIYEKLQVHNKMQAVQKAQRQRII